MLRATSTTQRTVLPRRRHARLSAGGGARTPTPARAPGFKPGASTSSATPAGEAPSTTAYAVCSSVVPEEGGDGDAVLDERAARQRGQERPPVRACVRRRGSRIATTPSSSWLRIRPPEALAELQHRRRERVVAEPVAAGGLDRLAARLVERVAGRRERQLVDHEQRERLAGDVDALPEGRGREQHGVDLGAEALEQPLARRVALDEHVVRDAAGDARAEHARAPGSSR